MCKALSLLNTLAQRTCMSTHGIRPVLQPISWCCLQAAVSRTYAFSTTSNHRRLSTSGTQPKQSFHNKRKMYSKVMPFLLLCNITCTTATTTTASTPTLSHGGLYNTIQSSK